MRDEHISVRVSPGEHLRLKVAAGVRSVSRSEFVRQAFVEEAERELSQLRSPQGGTGDGNDRG